jgi:hypothetical protein
VAKLPPVIVPVVLINPAVKILPPVTFPVAVTNPAVLIFPPTTFPVAEYILANIVPVLGINLSPGSSAKTVCAVPTAGTNTG